MRSRHGIALILALVILAGLILLGLPFLASQSSALSGTRSFAAREQARIQAESAHHLGIAVAAYAVSRQFAEGGDVPWSAVTPDGIDDAIGSQLRKALRAVDGRVAVDPTKLEAPVLTRTALGTDATQGCQVIDLSGRLDPNALSPAAWATLLNEAGISDGPDAAVRYCDWDRVANAPSGPLPASIWRNDLGQPNAARIGPLALALAELPTVANGPLASSGYRYVRPEQLLLAQPEPGIRYCITPDPEPADDRNERDVEAAAAAMPPTMSTPRPRLTRAELAQLAQRLSFWNPVQGRDRLTDVGTVIATDGPGPVIDLPIRRADRYGPIVGAGAQLEAGDQAGFADTRLLLGTALAAGQIAGQAIADEAAVGIRLAPTLNVHALDAGAARVTGINGGGRVTDFTGLLVGSDPLGQLVSGGRQVELPPVGLAGSGVVQVTAGGAVTNPRGQIQSDQHRSMVVQAVPQERALEKRMRSQDQAHAVIGGRTTANMEGGGKPYLRLNGERPDTTPGAHGLRSMVQPSWATGFRGSVPEHLAGNLDFLVHFGARQSVDLANLFDCNGLSAFAFAGGAAAPVAANLEPDGYRLDAAPPLGWAFLDGSGAQRGPLHVNAHRNQLSARHMSWWMRFDEKPTSLVVLLEARAPVENCFPPIRRLPPGDNAKQNLIRLTYEPRGGDGLLRLRICSASIEHPRDYGYPDGSALTFPKDDPTTFDIDERTHGGAQPGAQPAARRDPIDGVEYQTFVKGGLTAERWYHLAMMLGNDRPGGFAVALDHQVGRDLLRESGAPAMSQAGDHLWWPELRLDTPLPAKLPLTISGQDLVVPALTVSVPQGYQVADALPERGVIRIDDEYLIYDGITGASTATAVLTNVVRGRRTNTNSGAGNPNEHFPLVQEHRVGASVLPGGYQFQLNNGRFFRGATRLAQPVTDGDTFATYIWPKEGTAPQPTGNASVPAAGIYAEPDAITREPRPRDCRFRTWGFIKSLPLPTGTYTTGWGATIPMRYLGNPASPPAGMAPTGGPIASVDFHAVLPAGGLPARGIVQFQIVGVPNLATGMEIDELINEWTVSPPPNTAPDIIPVAPITAYFDNGAPGGTKLNNLVFDAGQTGLVLPPDRAYISALIISIEADSDIRTQPGNGQVNFPSAGAIQIDHQDNHRCEWLIYTDTRASPDGTKYFFLHRDGFPFFNDDPDSNPRGAQRTGYGGDVRRNLSTTDDRAPLNDPFPIGSTVLPVQNNNLGGLGGSDCFEAGDVATIVPDAIDGNVYPVQMVIRHAAIDGFPYAGTPTGNRWDTKNEWFAFTEKVPTAIADPVDRRSTLVIGRGWCGNDLSITGNNSQRQGLLPTLGALTGTGVAAAARVTFGAADPDRYAAPNTRPAAVAMRVDAVVAGDPDGNCADQNTPRAGKNGGCGITGFGPGGASLVLTAADIDVELHASLPVFRTGGNQRSYLGLALFDGEVIAYAATGNARVATIVGRGLLGTTAREHQLPTPIDVDGALRYGALPIIPLPYGPVARLIGDLPPDDWFPLETAVPYGNDGRPWDAPAALLMPARPAGAPAYEVVQFVGPQVRAPAPVTAPGSPRNGATVADVRYRVPPWLRGLYNTNAGNWKAGDIVLGWWPRHASALPGAARWSALGDSEKAAALRCRAFMWAGFPFGLHRMRVGIAGTTPASLDLLASDDLRLEARALATGLDWEKAGVAGLTAMLQPPAAVNAPAIFSSFANRPIDGFELRVFAWYDDSVPATTLDAISAAGSAWFEVRNVRLRAHAPAVPLAGDARR